MKPMQFQAQWRNWLMLVLGTWLVVSPFALGYAGPNMVWAVWNPVLTGVAVMVFAIAVLSKTQIWEEWILLLLGAWLVVSPFVLAYNEMMVPLWNSIIMGVLVGADALWSIIDLQGHHGEHTAA